ncbi:MAG TPA: GNAT family N-acetyltransferase [Hymenobacter sp.]|uniref:GNAT family N-acetyltransferase n=1 Tax=Hymenobacter sp. TaxID=1898978 RepID=UPI002D7ECCE8|nr:GNAT family N-acetyltransferase [Hymenobacter sp.]HET9503686.1 GNAT family N-acetyltransferase [Hymenobacter sp.]
MQIHHDPANQEFTAGSPSDPAELAYSLPQAGIIDFTHTFVPEAQRGQGLAEELARTGLAYARQQHLKVRTSCKFMRAFVQRNKEEYQDILEA